MPSCLLSWRLGNKLLGSVLLMWCNPNVSLSANNSTAFIESCAAIGWKTCFSITKHLVTQCLCVFCGLWGVPSSSYFWHQDLLLLLWWGPVTQTQVHPQWQKHGCLALWLKKLTPNLHQPLIKSVINSFRLFKNCQYVDDSIMNTVFMSANYEMQGSTLRVVRLGIPSSFCCWTT